MNWISIQDKLPDENAYVLCFFNSKELIINGIYIFPQLVLRFARLSEKMEPMFLNSVNYSFQPFHWMPLPNPPKEINARSK